jgi:two-component system NtrC family sensor kinase
MNLTVALVSAIAALAVAAVSHLLHRRAAARMIQQRDAARQLVEVGNDPVLVADIVDGRILLANTAMCALLDFPRDSLIQRRLPELHPPEFVERSAQRIAEIWEKKGMVYADLPLMRRDGEQIAVEVSATVMSFQGRAAMVMYVRDIRERLRDEQRIRDYATRIEQVNRELQDTQAQLVQSAKMAALGNLVAGVAHEINTPIGAVQANSGIARRALEVLQDRFQETATNEDRKLRRALDSMRQVCETNELATTRIDGIVRSLRNFARLDEAQQKVVDLHEGIDSTLTLLQHQLGQRITVAKRYGDIPPILCLPNQLNQVFMNLLGNAIVAIEGKGTITIGTAREGDDVVLRFTDSGVGIATKHLEHIFDPGYTTKGVGVGTGLGLSICYRIVQKHQGNLEVQSTPGEGSTFTVRLPISQPIAG